MPDMDKYCDLAIVLNIIEGSGLNYKKQSVLIEASLGGNVLVTNSALPGDLTTQFDNNLIWAADRASVKRMKDENLPVKLQCYSIKQNGERDFIGFVLIQMRSLVYSFGRKPSQIKPRWYKLLGLSDGWRQQKPELLLAISLVDRDCIEDQDQAIESAGNENAMAVENSKIEQSSPLAGKDELAIDILKEGLIQIGQRDVHSHQFHVIIHFKYIENLKSLLSQNNAYSVKKFNLKYKLFGSPANVEFSCETDKAIIDEKIIIKFRTSLKLLKEYFKKKFFIPIEVFHGDTLIGNLRISFGNALVPLPGSLNEFLQIYGARKNTFNLDDYCEVQPVRGSQRIENKLHYTLGIKYIMEPVSVSISSREKTSAQSNSEPSNRELNDKDILWKIQEEASRQFTNASVENDGASKYGAPRNADTDNQPATNSPIQKSPTSSPKRLLQPSTQIGQKLSKRCSQSIPRTFSYMLVLKDCKFQRKPMSGIWQVSLSHLEADNPLATRNFELSDVTSELVELNELNISLYFSSNKTEIINTINSKPCLVTLKGPRGFRAIAELDNENILSQEKTTGIVVFEDEHKDQVVMAHVYVELIELGLNFNNRESSQSPKRKSLHTIKLDEELTYKAIEELEDWKNKQKDQFLAELKRREINHLAHLSNEWQRRRSEEEAKLIQKLEHCELLTKSLEEAHASVKTKAEVSDARESYCLKTKQELEQLHDEKLRQLQNKTKLLEQELTHKLKEEEFKRMEFEMKVKYLDGENVDLKQRVRNLEISLQNSLPKEQVAGLYGELAALNEKAEREFNSKLFYKKQWARAIRELHFKELKNLPCMTDNPNFNDIIELALEDLNNEKNYT